MAGVKALRKIQLGREDVAAGTAAAAGTVWRGTGTIEDQRENVYPEEDVGYLSGLIRRYTPMYLAAIEFEETPATFEQLPHILEAGVKTATAVQDGAGSDYVYTYTFATTARPTIKTYTIEGGDNTQAEEMEYGFVSDFTLAGKAGEALTMQANWLGRQVSTCSFTAAQTAPTVEEILLSKGTLYLDATGGTIGDTQVTSTLRGVELAVTTGIHPKFTADGSLYFTYHEYGPIEVLATLTFVHNSSAVTEIANWRSETVRLLRLLFEGSAFDTAGTTYSKHTVIVDLAGTWDHFEKLGEEDGNDIVEGVFRAQYSSADTLFASIVVVNELSSLPG